MGTSTLETPVGGDGDILARENLWSSRNFARSVKPHGNPSSRESAFIAPCILSYLLIGMHRYGPIYCDNRRNLKNPVDRNVVTIFARNDCFNSAMLRRFSLGAIKTNTSASTHPE
jgi:hypothetical protein